MKIFSIYLIILFLTSCSNSRYSQYYDSAPSRPPTSLELTDAKVTNEAIGRGNKPYTIKGIRYNPMTERKPYKEVGTASWYGKKFHGHLTSNGETYDMYAMSAAHKTLPLPSFVKVTNLSNNKSVIVRVNDRGPFYQDRIIDLSFSAAYKIGVYDTGTAKVQIEVINKTSIESAQHSYFVKVAGFTSLAEAEESAKGLSFMVNKPVKAQKDGDKYALFFGSFNELSYAKSLKEKIKQFGFSDISVVTKK